MKKINYFPNCEDEYLRCLGFKDENNSYTTSYHNLNQNWKAIQNNNIKTILPIEICDLLTCKYEKLVDYFIAFNNLSDSDFDIVKDDIRNVFEYEGSFSRRIADFFIKHSSELNLYSCYYCDSAYSGVYKVEKNNQRTFDVEHFFSNEQYPMFAISLYNFVPSCQVCNSRVKGKSNFLDFYGLNKNSNTMKQDLLELSPASENFEIEKELKIKIYPDIHYHTYYRKSVYDLWTYNPCFREVVQTYQLFFDSNQKKAYAKHIKAFRIQERYNNIAIKSHGLFIMDLKRKYPDSNLKLISQLLSNKDETGGVTVRGFSFSEIKNAIFHKDDKCALLQKLRNDILDD